MGLARFSRFPMFCKVWLLLKSPPALPFHLQDKQCRLNISRLYDKFHHKLFMSAISFAFPFAHSQTNFPAWKTFLVGLLPLVPSLRLQFVINDLFSFPSFSMEIVCRDREMRVNTFTFLRSFAGWYFVWDSNLLRPRIPLPLFTTHNRGWSGSDDTLKIFFYYYNFLLFINNVTSKQPLLKNSIWETTWRYHHTAPKNSYFPSKISPYAEEATQ